MLTEVPPLFVLILRDAPDMVEVPFGVDAKPFAARVDAKRLLAGAVINVTADRDVPEFISLTNISRSASGLDEDHRFEFWVGG